MKIDVGYVAKLANLPLTSQEEKKYQEQLSKILDYVKQLNAVSTSQVEPTYNVSPPPAGGSNVMRSDEVSECLTQEEAISNAQKTKDGFIVSKGVFGK